MWAQKSGEVNKLISDNHLQNSDQNSYFSRKAEELARKKRQYEIADGVMRYFSLNNSKEQFINGQVFDNQAKEIVCRHYAYYFLICEQTQSSYKNIISDRTNIIQVPFLMDNLYDKFNIFYNADSYFFSSTNRICESLYQLFDQIDNYRHNIIYANLLSCNHAMGLVLKYKPKSKIYVIKFYDPNDMSHYRLVFENKEAIKNLKISSLIPNEATRTAYVMNFKSQDIRIAVYKNPEQYNQLKSFNILPALKLEIEQQLQQGSYENFILRLQNLLSIKVRLDSISPILSSLNIVDCICEKYNDIELRFNLSEYFQIITNSQLSIENKINLITSGSDINKTLLNLSQYLEGESKIKGFLHAIIGSDLPKEFTMKFIEIDVLKVNSPDILKFYARAIMESVLDSTIIKLLLIENKSDLNGDLKSIYTKLEKSRYDDLFLFMHHKKKPRKLELKWEDE